MLTRHVQATRSLNYHDACNDTLIAIGSFK